ncbi:MAG: ABC transporter permease, partial [Solirubrobacterales bacterium]|nr:ABC transporter permease [Solirubrobacterales bacterium]
MNEPTSGVGTPADPQGSVTYQEPEEEVVEEEAVAQEQLAVTAPEVLADSLGEYLRAWGKRIRSGESGVVPVIVGLVLVVIFFQIEQSTFLSAGNLVNLFVQAATFILFAAAEIYALLLSEIDLSVGAVAGVGAFVIAELIAPPVNLVWWLGIAGGLFICAAIGVLQGTLITRLHLPSFVVTLGGLLGFTGVIIELAQIDKTAVGGVISISTTSPVYNLVNANMSPTV